MNCLVNGSVNGYACVCAVFSVGPCALEYTKLKTSDHFWTDPSANELVQRHRIHGAHRGQDASAGRRPALGVSVEAVWDQLLQFSGSVGVWWCVGVSVWDGNCCCVV